MWLVVTLDSGYPAQVVVDSVPFFLLIVFLDGVVHTTGPC